MTITDTAAHVRRRDRSNRERPSELHDSDQVAAKALNRLDEEIGQLRNKLRDPRFKPYTPELRAELDRVVAEHEQLTAERAALVATNTLAA